VSLVIDDNRNEAFGLTVRNHCIALFGLVYALLSRSGLYMFEHSYFLLS